MRRALQAPSNAAHLLYAGRSTSPTLVLPTRWVSPPGGFQFQVGSDMPLLSSPICLIVCILGEVVIRRTDKAFEQNPPFFHFLFYKYRERKKMGRGD